MLRIPIGISSEWHRFPERPRQHFQREALLWKDGIAPGSLAAKLFFCSGFPIGYCVSPRRFPMPYGSFSFFSLSGLTVVGRKTHFFQA
jgi:hypothetical protein